MSYFIGLSLNWMVNVVLGKSFREILIANVSLQKSIRKGVVAHLHMVKKYLPELIRLF